MVSKLYYTSQETQRIKRVLNQSVLDGRSALEQMFFFFFENDLGVRLLEHVR